MNFCVRNGSSARFDEFLLEKTAVLWTFAFAIRQYYLFKWMVWLRVKKHGLAGDEWIRNIWYFLFNLRPLFTSLISIFTCTNKLCEYLRVCVQDFFLLLQFHQFSLFLFYLYLSLGERFLDIKLWFWCSLILFFAQINRTSVRGKCELVSMNKGVIIEYCTG